MCIKFFEDFRDTWGTQRTPAVCWPPLALVGVSPCFFLHLYYTFSIFRRKKCWQGLSLHGKRAFTFLQGINWSYVWQCPVGENYLWRLLMSDGWNTWLSLLVLLIAVLCIASRYVQVITQLNTSKVRKKIANASDLFFAFPTGKISVFS